MKKIALLALTVFQLHAASNSHPPVLVVPGIGGMGLTSYVAGQLGSSSSHNVMKVDSPIYTDFGQSTCQKYLYKSFNALGTNQDYLLHASSQGTATALNFLATYPHTQGRLKALVLESSMASANVAISHRLNSSCMLGYLLLPYLARLFLLRYSPSGMQAIKSIDKLKNKDFPIILVHATGDDLLPYSGACALYYRLKEQGHKHIYFITKKSEGHFTCLLQGKLRVQSILAAHEILSADQTPETDLSQYQPDHMQYRAIYEELRCIEKAHTVIGGTMIGACAVFMMYYLLMLTGAYA